MFIVRFGLWCRKKRGGRRSYSSASSAPLLISFYLRCLCNVLSGSCLARRWCVLHISTFRSFIICCNAGLSVISVDRWILLPIVSNSSLVFALLSFSLIFMCFHLLSAIYIRLGGYYCARKCLNSFQSTKNPAFAGSLGYFSFFLRAQRTPL